MTVWELKELSAKNSKDISLTEQQRNAWKNALDGANAYIGWQEPFKEMFSHYKGKVQTEIGSVKFINANTLLHRGKERTVECRIVVNYSYIVDPKRYSVSAEEKTLEIIGGCSSGNLTKEEAINQVKRMMERYQFKKRETEQISLF